jgi:glycerophosphoryl diester phosphodiesterase
VKRIGHKGADHIAPGNTFASFDAALVAGADMIEFDVLPERSDGTGKLVLAHDFDDVKGRSPHTLDEGLDHFTQSAYDGIDLLVDLKLSGYEERVVRALEERGLAGRSLISTMEEPSLDLLHRRHPEISLGWSVPRIRRDPMRNPVIALPALALLQYARLALPGVAANRVRRGEINALMAHWRLVTPRLVQALREAGGELYVWTVDDAEQIARFEALGVSGVISNDPRLFAGA